MSAADLLLHDGALAALRAHAASAAPREACGLLTGPAGDAVIADQALPSPNLAPAGADDAFEIDAALHLAAQRGERARGRRIVGIYHSHPRSAPLPSARDRAGAWDFGLVWLILGQDGACRAWWPGPQGFVEARIVRAS